MCSKQPGSLGRAARVTPFGATLPYWLLHQVGFAVPRLSPDARCALTAPFHPSLPVKTGGLFSVALSCGLRRLAVNQHPALRCPDFPPATPSCSGRRSPELLQPLAGTTSNERKLLGRHRSAVSPDTCVSRDRTDTSEIVQEIQRSPAPLMLASRLLSDRTTRWPHASAEACPCFRQAALTKKAHSPQEHRQNARCCRLGTGDPHHPAVGSATHARGAVTTKPRGFVSNTLQSSNCKDFSPRRLRLLRQRPPRRRRRPRQRLRPPAQQAQQAR